VACTTGYRDWSGWHCAGKTPFALVKRYPKKDPLKTWAQAASPEFIPFMPFRVLNGGSSAWPDTNVKRKTYPLIFISLQLHTDLGKRQHLGRFTP
jgi:hypothetical protein